MSAIGPKRADCLEACMETASASLRALKYCLRWGGPLAECAHLLKLLDCAHACRKTAERLSGGEPALELIVACADACERCALSCDVFDDLELRECAELCRYCAPACRRAVLEP